jgi:hypothetical protein
MKRLVFIFSVVIFSSCTVQFTSTMKTELEKNNVDIKKIQFYNSQSFVLQRELSSTETGIDKGKIKIREGKRIEIVKIPQKTPSVCDSISGEKLYIIFEYGKDKLIPFVSDSYNKYYSLITPGSTDVPLDIKNYSDNTSSKFYGTISYDGKSYYYGYLSKPKLKVKKSQVEKVLKETRTLNGIKIK